MPSPFHRPGLAQPVPGAPVIGHLNTGRGRIGSKKHAHGRGLSIPAQGLRHIQRIRHHRGRKIPRAGMLLYVISASVPSARVITARGWGFLIKSPEVTPPPPAST